MEDNLDQDWLIVGGSPRSGTTLMALLLNSHPNIFLTNEHNLPQILNILKKAFFKENEFYRINSNFERNKGVKETWTNKDILDQTLQKKNSLNGVAAFLYQQNARALGKVNPLIVGDKLPRYYFVDFEEFSNVVEKPIKIIHISRHPLDVINSMLIRYQNRLKGKDTWTLTSTLEESLNEWIHGWNSVVKNESQQILHIKYEDLCLFDTKIILEKISSFLLIPNTFNANIIETNQSKHFERKALNDDHIIKIKNHLGSLLNDWNETNLQVLIERYGEFPTINTIKKESKILSKINSLKKKIFRKKI
ncbi:sulfotransferase [Salinimicrobium tongyeongense]|uniref:Sulfotransferase n=1 Tax=Salinimicrobium tongyeongense TaxID=2809707 RepID=A0ABY6NS33_9FLAO|nr:sulfotransferase [Salinimicrobium tongyeongense]UZH55643.1 sulfotransferase [Salinimicrobium tongyeongense]